jgi:hypothetical protein
VSNVKANQNESRRASHGIQLLKKGRVEVGKNTSIVALRVVGGDEREPSAWGYHWATLSLVDIKKGTWPSMLGGFRI